MAVRRLCYLAVLEGCLVFYVAYREWVSYLVLVAVLGLPFLSLLISLPAILTVHTHLDCPARVTAGTPLRPRLNITCKWPAPPVRCRLQVRHCILDTRDTCKPGKPLPTDHCGTLQLQIKRAWVFDYLGLWQLPLGKQSPQTVTVLPEPVAIERLPGLEQYQAAAWQPKPGGFSENHELREYRPGDELRQIHWKLSGKTGKLIYREPMEPKKQRLLLTLVLRGTEEALDHMLGQLLWLSSFLLEQQLPHEIRCLTGRGLESFPVTDTQSQLAAMEEILSAPAACETQMPPSLDGVWQFHVGGDAHEAD